jgi:hypothetical protein
LVETRRNKKWDWHTTARVTAILVLVDQAVGPVTHIPQSAAIVVACVSALFSPRPRK